MPVISLSQQLVNFDKEFAMPTKNEELARQQIVSYFQSKVEYYYNLKCDLFGSFLTKTAMPYSDIDLNITFDKPDLTREAVIKLLEEIPTKIVGWEYNLLKDAKIPVLTMNKKSHIVQLTCNTGGVSKSCFMLTFIEKFPNTRLIIQLIKQLLHEHTIDSISCGGLNTYSIFVMMIALFHQFTDLDHNTSHSKLLLRFLEFYTCLDWNSALITGRGVYFNSRQNSLFIEDPMEYGRNLTHSSWQLAKVKDLFSYALDNLNKNSHYPAFLKLTPYKAHESRI
eukprot:NODE_517_length_7343_cov_0.253313.p4 type:complete len:281 gc:universal NODE_517_length_7343_cov_0.253313:4515-5357(+)